MRIFYAADSSPNAALQSSLWRDNLYEPLVDLGHDVVEFQYDLKEILQNLDAADDEQRRFVEKNRPRTSRELLRQLRSAHSVKPVDLFFSYFYDACVLPQAIDEIRSLGIRTMNWFCNASYQLHLVAEISPHYDWCLVPERFRLTDYAALGAHPIYCQLAANPRIYRPRSSPVDPFDVTFVGQAYGERPLYIRHLLDRGIDVRVWGPGWEAFSEAGEERPGRTPFRQATHVVQKLLTAKGWRAARRRLGRLAGRQLAASINPPPIQVPASIVGGPLPDAEMIGMYSRSKINLGFSACGDTHTTGQRIVQVRLRDFEVPMSGGFYMVEYMEELGEFYDLEKEIVCYRDRDELTDKIRYYLSHDSERERIRRAGHMRALNDHSWHRRFQSVFEQIGAA